MCCVVRWPRFELLSFPHRHMHHSFSSHCTVLKLHEQQEPVPSIKGS
jgi:hypothetical protein